MGNTEKKVEKVENGSDNTGIKNLKIKAEKGELNSEGAEDGESGIREDDDLSPPLSYDRMPRREIVCLDMKSFYASVEAVERGLDPFRRMLAVVGSRERKGSVILAASPALKEKYNIGTGDRHRDLPPDDEITVVEPRMALYIDRSVAITELLTEFAPIDDIFTYSIDESWVDLTDVPLDGKSFRARARHIQHEIYRRFNLVASLGLGPNMFLSKVAMDIEGKKSGLAHWQYEDVPEKLWPVPLSDCWGIGRRLENRLNQYGIRQVGDIARLDPEFMERKLGAVGEQIYQHAWGIDFSRPSGFFDDRVKSIGRGITLFEDFCSARRLMTVIFNLCEEIAFRARRQGLAGRTVSLSLSYSYEHSSSGFRVQRTRDYAFNLEQKIAEVCRELLQENYSGAPVRKVSVTLGNLQAADSIQLDLFSDSDRRQQLALARDEIRKKFGPQALSFGISHCEKELRCRIKGNIGGHKA